MTFTATVLTLYPEMFPGPLGVSLAGRALEEGTWSLDTVNIRDFAMDKHRTVDDTPAGGGAMLVLGEIPDLHRLQRPGPLLQRPSGKRHAQRPGKHLRIER